MVTCNICGSNTVKIQVQERMLGFKEKFDYYQCTNCGHTHIGVIPANIEKYYNSNEYYSFSNKNSFSSSGSNKIDAKTKLKKALLSVGVKTNILYSAALKALLTIKGLNKKMKILDYGCGAGQFVKELIDVGFTYARGYDLFLPQNISADGELYL